MDMISIANYTQMDFKVEANYFDRNKHRIEKIFNENLTSVPEDVRSLYYDSYEADDVILVEASALLRLREMYCGDDRRAIEYYIHVLTYCPHERRYETLNKIIIDAAVKNSQANYGVKINISSPWRSDVLARFILGRIDLKKVEPAPEVKEIKEPTEESE